MSLGRELTGTLGLPPPHPVSKWVVEVLRAPGLAWLGLPRRSEAAGFWCLQSPGSYGHRDESAQLHPQGVGSEPLARERDVFKKVLQKFLFKLT